MVFTTQLFLFYFLPLVLVSYYALSFVVQRAGMKREGVSLVRNGLLLLASYVFYGWWSPWFIPLMLAVTVVNYVGGLWIARAGTPRRRKWILGVVVILSLGALGFFKYLVFFQTNANHVLAWVGSDTLGVLRIALPIGISFYTFQALSYSVDVYRGDAPRARSLADFACYVGLYPQLVAGPIVRYHTVAGQLLRRSHTVERFSSGVALFVLGFAKKVLLADPVGRLADVAFGASALTAADAWFGAVAYALQIYFDFSGYSDMAIGLGRMIGFEFPKNFDAPYRSESITDFWRRWHISLSTFLRDYLYIPLGGNRKGRLRTYTNLLIVMLLGGLWHGASWTFLAWGAYHAVLLMSERALGKQSLYAVLPRPLRMAATFVLVLFGWVLFRSESIAGALEYLGTMFGAGSADARALLLGGLLYYRGAVLTMAACLLAIFAPVQAHDWAGRVTWPKALVLGPAFGVAIMAMLTQSFSPFLYFQF